MKIDLSFNEPTYSLGVMVDGSDVTCNESALTGESDDKKKDKNKDVFFISGATVSTGYCKVCACAVGEQSRWGKTKAKLSAESVPTPLQEKLDTLAGQIGYLGMGCAGATFVVMVAVWVLYPSTRVNNHQTIFDFVLHSFIVAGTVIQQTLIAFLTIIIIYQINTHYPHLSLLYLISLPLSLSEQ